MTKATQQRVPVSEKAVYQRMTRALARRGQQLFRHRRVKDAEHTGRFYTVDLRRNCIADVDVDLDKHARDLGVLKPWEEIRVR